MGRITIFALACVVMVGCGDDSTTNPDSGPPEDGHVHDDSHPHDVGQVPDSGELDGSGDVDPIEFPTGTGPDNCALVTLNVASWGAIHASFNTSTPSDPFFQLHDEEAGFFFNVELFTMFGAGWTGQTGTFSTDCTDNGICVHLVPMDNGDEQYVADAMGEIEITALSETGGSLQLPVDITLRNLSMRPSFNTPGAPGCYHITEVRLTK